MDDFELAERLDGAEKQTTEAKTNWKVALDVLVLLYNFVMYFVDVGLDIHVAFKMAIGYRIASLAVVFVQSLGSNLASWIWYSNANEALNRWEILMHFLLLAPVLRCGKSIYYAWKMCRSKDKKDLKYTISFYENNADIAFMSLLEGFLEAGPQLVIQIGEWINTSLAESSFKLEPLRLVSVIFSLISLGFIMQNYHASLRKSQDNTGDVSCKGRAVLLFWHFMIEVSRVSVLVCLIVMNPYYLLACIVHILVFFIYLSRPANGPQRNFENLYIWHQLLRLTLSCLYIFTAIPVREGSTRKFYTLIYSVFAVEGVIVFIMGYFMLPQIPFYFIWPLVSTFCFILGLLFMAIYYKCYHPKVEQKFNGIKCAN